MIRSINLKHQLLAALLATLSIALVNCSGSEQQQQEDLETSDEDEAAAPEQGDLGNDSADQEFAGEENFGNGGDAPVNNAAGDDLISNNQLANLTNDGMSNNADAAVLDAAPANIPVNNAVAMNPAITNAAPMNAAAVPMNAAAPADAAVAASNASPSERGVVRYVSNSSLQVVDQPGSATVVGSLEQGDHPVVWDKGEWAQLANGKYVSAKGLTDQGVGRQKRNNPWR